MKKIVLILLSMAVFGISIAQEKTMEKSSKWGRVFVDFNVSGVNFDEDVVVVSSGSGEKDKGFRIGVLEDFRIGESPLYFETGLYMAFFGCSYNVNDYLAKERLLHFGVPVNLTFPIGDGDVWFIPSVGVVPQLFAVGNLEMAGQKIHIFDEYDMGDAAYKRFQFGLNIGASVAIKRFILNYNFTRNFTTLENELGSRMLSHNFGVGYLF